MLVKIMAFLTNYGIILALISAGVIYIYHSGHSAGEAKNEEIHQVANKKAKIRKEKVVAATPSVTIERLSNGSF